MQIDGQDVTTVKVCVSDQAHEYKLHRVHTARASDQEIFDGKHDYLPSS